MSKLVNSIVGSGTVESVRGILPPLERGNNAEGRGIRIGTQVIVANPEDFNSVDAFATSGITVGTSPVQILNAINNPLPRTREVVVQNLGSADVYISHRDSGIVAEGFEVTVPGANGLNFVKIPVLHNVSIWAATSAGTANIRMIIY